MLPDHLFGPLDLDAALERAYDRGEERAAWELLADALMDPRARGDRRIPAYVVELIDDYTLDGWEQDTLDLLHDLIGVEPALSGPLRAPMAELHGQLGDAETALGLLRTRRSELARLPEDERDEEFYPAAAMIAGPFDPAFAADLLDEGLKLALDLGRPPATVRYLDLLRRRFGGPGPCPRRSRPTPRPMPGPAGGSEDDPAGDREEADRAAALCARRRPPGAGGPVQEGRPGDQGRRRPADRRRPRLGGGAPGPGRAGRPGRRHRVAAGAQRLVLVRVRPQVQEVLRLARSSGSGRLRRESFGADDREQSELLVALAARGSGQHEQRL